MTNKLHRELTAHITYGFQTAQRLRPRDLRFGLDGGAPQTLEQIGAELGVTPQRVAQLQARAIRRLADRDVIRRLKK